LLTNIINIKKSYLNTNLFRLMERKISYYFPRFQKLARSLLQCSMIKM